MRKIKFALLTAGILLGVFWILVGIGPRAANDFPFGYRDYVKDGFNLPQAWSTRGNGFGEPSISVLWGWPLDFLYGLGAKAGIDFSILFRLLGIVPIFALGLWGIRRLLKHYEINPIGIFVGSLFFLLNTYLILLIDGGQISIALAYSWFPTAFLTVKTSIEKSLKNKIVAGFSVAILAIFDIRFVYLLVILLGIDFVFQLIFSSKQNITKLFLEWVKAGATIALVLVGINIYWIVPVLLSKVSVLPASYQDVSQTSFLNFTSLGHSIFLLQPHWYKNVFGQVTPLLPLFVFIPILVFLAPILKRKDKMVGFWLVVAVVSIFLVKGSNPPFGEVYQWLFIHVPGFNIFRDSTKFFFLSAFSYSVLIGITTDEIVKRFSKLKFLYLILVTSYLLFLIRPVWTNQMTGLLSVPSNQKEYFNLADKLESDKSFGRILWMPSRPPLGFASSTHPGVDALRLVEKKPYASLVTGSYELLNYLRNPFAPQLLDISGIGYISYPFPDTRREELKQDNIDYYYWFLNKLESYSWLTPVKKDGNVPLLKVNNHQDKFFIPANLFWVNGSSDIYQELLKVPNFKLANNAFVFVSDNPESRNRISDFPSSLEWEHLSQNDKTKLFQLKNTAKVTYEEVSPTQYKVSVEGLTKPGVLAFSESYDPLWQINGKGSIPLYGLINGFNIEKDGQYDVYFSPQKYVMPGLLVSGLTLGMLVALLLLK